MFWGFPNMLTECSEVLNFCLGFNGMFPWQFSSISLGQCSWPDIPPNYGTQKTPPSQIITVYFGVLVLAGIELIFFTVASMGLRSGFVLKTVLII